jgi:hypothetical protein
MRRHADNQRLRVIPGADGAGQVLMRHPWGRYPVHEACRPGSLTAGGWRWLEHGGLALWVIFTARLECLGKLVNLGKQFIHIDALDNMVHIILHVRVAIYKVPLCMRKAVF